MSDLDELRRSALEIADEPEETVVIADGPARSTRFLGMTALERMILSFFVFLFAVISSLVALLLTGRGVF